MNPSRDLRTDTGGAIALIGVFFALALTASLWFMIGIGDAIAFRETAQEATDATTFSSAVVHARSMNFIAAINLVMLGVTVVYLVLAIIADLFSVALLACTTVAIKACSYGTYGAVPAALEVAQQTAQQASDRYKDGLLRTVYKSGDQLQKVIAKAAPWTGSFAGNRVAKRYDKDLVASTLGLSNVPSLNGGSGSQGGGSTTTSAKEERLGLPVVAVKAKTLCDRAFNSMKTLGSDVKKDSGNDFSQGFGAVDEAVTEAAKSAGSSRYCKGGIFDEDGPKIVHKDAQNGSDYMQVYGFMIKAKLKDKNRSEQAVGALARMKKKTNVRNPKSNVYVSQAEFFYDCTSTWEAAACNADDAALYSPRWMVRLRRMRSPVAGAALASQAVSLLTTGAAAVAGQALGIPDVDQAIQGMTDAAKTEVGSILSEQIGAFFNAPALDLSGFAFPNFADFDFSNVKGAAADAAKDYAKGAAKDYAKGAAKDYVKGGTKGAIESLPVPGYFH